MTLERFCALVDGYGARPERWPEEERDAALALLARSPMARARLAEAARLDAVLDRLPGGAARPELAARILAAAPRRAAMRRRAPIAAATLALAASLAVWLVRTPPAPPAPLGIDAVAQLGVLDVPTDVFLSDLDADDEPPAFGCDDPSLACDDALGPPRSGRSAAALEVPA